jgi:hypothetical protein
MRTKRALSPVNRLVRYDVALPKKALLVVAQVFGIFLILAGGAWLLVQFNWWLTPSTLPTYQSEEARKASQMRQFKMRPIWVSFIFNA